MLAAFVFGLLGTAAAIASPVPVTSSPTPAAVEPVVCGVKVGPLLALDADPRGLAHSYLIALAPQSSDPVTASGTIVLYDATSRWEVPFIGVVAARRGQKVYPAPILIHFAQPRKLDSGRVVSLVGPSGGPCYPVSAIATALDATTEPATSAYFGGLAKSATPVEAPAALTDPSPLCAKSEEPAHPTSLGQLVAPFLNATGTVDVSVSLDDDGGIIQDSIYKSAGSSLLDIAALRAAESSAFAAAIHTLPPRVGHLPVPGGV